MKRRIYHEPLKPLELVLRNHNLKPKKTLRVIKYFLKSR